LSENRKKLGAATAGDNAVFGGGVNASNVNLSTVEYRNSTGLGTTGINLSLERQYVAAATAK
jgi:hypothetical protein